MPIPVEISEVLARLQTAKSGTHKGQNGKLLILGGSELFHAASAWSLQVAARVADMVFYSSVPQNNALVQEAKHFFWDGMVVPRTEVLSYLEEADCVLIGPGMTRMEKKPEARPREYWLELTRDAVDWEHDTWGITNWLLAQYPQKRWVIDAGALQMADETLFSENMILTPHAGEFLRLFGREMTEEEVRAQSRAHNNCLIVAKGERDLICQGDACQYVSGGNAGMIKGGSGDVLAGLIAALYCKNSAMDAAVAGSFLCKASADHLYRQMGSFYTTTELAEQIPKTMHAILQEARG